jgi:hypothetical protein
MSGAPSTSAKGDKVDEAALKDLIRAAVALNLKNKTKPRRNLHTKFRKEREI